MAKATRTFSLDEEVKMLLERDSETNHSALVNKMLQSYYAVGDTTTTAQEVRLQQLEKEIKHEEQRHEEQMEQLHNEKQRLEEQLNETYISREEAIEEATRLLTPDQLAEDNLAVQRIAGEARMDADELVEEVDQMV